MVTADPATTPTPVFVQTGTAPCTQRLLASAFTRVARFGVPTVFVFDVSRGKNWKYDGSRISLYASASAVPASACTITQRPFVASRSATRNVPCAVESSRVLPLAVSRSPTTTPVSASGTVGTVPVDDSMFTVSGPALSGASPPTT
jgi:hypothetical protein